ncbi:glyoxylase-like metal-dependent hydrolase (beta-lactamase superfamily II) [Tepidamorphus gemmatus]|uniref:Glyoxylase-like metal-dependent hydrolase (Beta-lactamase superfamily II) n=1 Tax=Tepidamorphus gemmatus TaxID=747076 RepID=A0A4R3ML84_9HYPH|nr:MBL fold metallo-hydrolase [Tepidamorphus gemmatus]TCT13548.1 glyoxylase-like metal-dependent hydrolase (beta-lactamase superfamily II) [Tepidamorphus gemmatus]
MELTRRNLLAACAGGLALAAGLGLADARRRPAAAAQPRAAHQVPGIYRLSIGDDIEVTALLDGYIDLGTNLFRGAPEEEVRRLQEAAFVPVGPAVRSGVNAFAVNAGGRLALIDAGGRNLLGPTLGRLPGNLKAAGIDPAAVDLVVATHLHPDHVGGLVTGDGAAVFPNAELVVHEADWNFWTNADLMAKANEQGKMFFQAAQAAITPYAKRTRLIGDDEEVMPGLRSIGLPGHTPGHTGFVVHSGPDTLLIWGDIVHSALLQVPHPDWSIAFDIGPDLAVATRRKAFAMAASDRLLVAGMHLPFPGIGRILDEGGVYQYQPEPWRFEP